MLYKRTLLLWFFVFFLGFARLFILFFLYLYYFAFYPSSVIKELLNLLYRLVLYLTDHAQTGNMKYQKLYIFEITSLTKNGKKTLCMHNEKNITLVSWSVWHLPLVTFVFCGFSLTAVGKSTPSIVQLSWHTQQDGMEITCRIHLLKKVSQDVYVMLFANTLISHLKHLCVSALVCAHTYVYEGAKTSETLRQRTPT